MKNLDSYPTIFATVQEADWDTKVFAGRAREETRTELASPKSAPRVVPTQGQMEVLKTWFPQAAQMLADVFNNAKDR